MPDGRINHLLVVKSSGYELLDQNALESVQKAAPFPKPPVMAELRVPISYSLSRG
jgi:protein TonB